MAGFSGQIAPGTNVYSSDDSKVGDVTEVGGGYLLVQKGWLFTRDLYIPTSAIARVDQDGVYLNLSSAEIENQSWDEPPVEETATSGYSTTATTGTSDYAASTTTIGTRADMSDARTVEAGDSVVIPVVEEDIAIGKREVESGGVRVTQRVEERPVHEQVTLRDESVQVERRAVDRAATDADFANVREGVVEVRERDEEAVVDKQARIVEEVVVGKDVRQRTETIEDTVRRTDVDVQELRGTTDVRSGTVSGDVAASNRVSSTSDEGAIEGGLSRAGNAAERATGLDLDRDQDVGQRDPRNNY